MTKAELIAALAEYPDDMRVFLDDWQEQYTSPALCGTVEKMQRHWNDHGIYEPKKSDEYVIILGVSYD